MGSSSTNHNWDGEPGEPFAGDTFYSASTALQRVASYYGVNLKIPAGVNAYLEQVSFDTATGTLYVAVMYKLSAFPTANAQIFQARSSSGAVCTASLRTNGNIALHQGGSIATVLAQGGPCPTGVQFRIVYAIVGTSFSAKIYPTRNAENPSATVGPATITAGQVVTVRHGNPAAGGIVGADLEVGWIITSPTTEPGKFWFVDFTLDPADGYADFETTLTVTDEDGPAAPGRQYRVNWGNGTTTAWQSSPVFERDVTTTGVWDVWAEARDVA